MLWAIFCWDNLIHVVAVMHSDMYDNDIFQQVNVSYQSAQMTRYKVLTLHPDSPNLSLINHL